MTEMTNAPAAAGGDTSAASASTAAPANSADALDSAVSAAFGGGEQASDTGAATDTAQTDTATSGDRSRDDKGRFAAKDGTTDTPADTAAITDGATAPQNAAEQTQTDPAAAPTVEAPASMSAAEREAFNAASPELQGFMTRREKELRAATTKAEQKAADALKRVEAIEPAVPILDHFAKRFGVPPAHVVREWATVQDGLLRDPKGTLLALAQRTGVDLTPQQQPDASADTYVDPQLVERDKRIEMLEQQLAAVFGKVQTREQAEQHAALQQTAQTIESFRAETAADGSPKYPHFDAVREQMAFLLESGQVPAGDLAAAYNKAIRLNDDVWSRIEAEQQAKTATQAEARRKAEAEKAEQERRRQLAEAQKVGRVNARGTGAPGARPAATSLDDAVNQAVASLK